MSRRSTNGRRGRSADGADLVSPGDLGHKRKSRTPDASPPEIEDIRSYVEDRRSECAVPFRVEYIVTLNRNCCKNARGPRITVRSTNETWKSDDPGEWMKRATLHRIQNDHGPNSKDGCELTWTSGVGAIYVVGPPSIWTNLWANAENQMNRLKLQDLKVADERKKAAETTHQEIEELDWEKGTDFTNPVSKSRAKKNVIRELGRACGKSLEKATTVLSSVVSHLANEEGFDENEVISDANRDSLALMWNIEDAVTNLKQGKGGKGGNISNSSARLLTGITAFLSGAETTRNELGSFGINSQAKYAISGKANREEFDEYKKKTGPIKPGEKVEIRGGGPGIFQSKDGTKLRVLLKPWDVEVYNFFKAAANKTSGPGSSIPRAPDMRHRHEKAAALAVGDWVIFDGNGDEDEPFWLGRVMSNPEWGGSGVKVNRTGSVVSYQNNTLRVQPNEVAINLMWYELKDISASSKKYRVSRTELNSVVNNNFYMIMGGSEVNDRMHRIFGESNPVPRNRTGRQVVVGRSLSSYSVPRSNLQRSEQDWHDREKSSVWQMDDCLREDALMRCVT